MLLLQISLQRSPLSEHIKQPVGADVQWQSSKEGYVTIVHHLYDDQQPFAVPAHHAGL